MDYSSLLAVLPLDWCRRSPPSPSPPQPDGDAGDNTGTGDNTGKSPAQWDHVLRSTYYFRPEKERRKEHLSPPTFIINLKSTSWWLPFSVPYDHQESWIEFITLSGTTSHRPAEAGPLHNSTAELWQGTLLAGEREDHQHNKA